MSRSLIAVTIVIACAAAQSPADAQEPDERQFQSAVEAVAKVGGEFVRRWNFSPAQRTELFIEFLHNVTDAQLKKLPPLPFEHGVMLRAGKITDEGLAEIASRPNLTALDLSRVDITDEGLAALGEATKLAGVP